MSNMSFVYQARVVGGQLRNNIEGRPRWLYEPELRARLDKHAQGILDDYLRYRMRQHEQAIDQPTSAELEQVS